ncbi:MAG: hypothetical protein ACYS9X_14480 [Planctomycetota bacterium]|jgi:hypothetical protein
MAILEIVHLRSPACPIEHLSEHIAMSIEAGHVGAEVVTLYRRDSLETDLAVHIRRDGESGEGGASALGLLLASELKTHGLVAHTVWREL